MEGFPRTGVSPLEVWSPHFASLQILAFKLFVRQLYVLLAPSYSENMHTSCAIHVEHLHLSSYWTAKSHVLVRWKVFMLVLPSVSTCGASCICSQLYKRRPYEARIPVRRNATTVLPTKTFIFQHKTVSVYFLLPNLTVGITTLSDTLLGKSVPTTNCTRQPFLMRWPVCCWWWLVIFF